MAPKHLRKTFLGCIAGKWLGEDLHLKRVKKKIHTCKCSKVNALRKWRSRGSSQEETCVNFHQDEGSVKTFLITLLWLQLQLNLSKLTVNLGVLTVQLAGIQGCRGLIAQKQSFCYERDRPCSMQIIPQKGAHPLYLHNFLLYFSFFC